MMALRPLPVHARRLRASPAEARWAARERREVGGASRRTQRCRLRPEGGCAGTTKWRNWDTRALLTDGCRSRSAWSTWFQRQAGFQLQAGPGGGDRARMGSRGTSRSSNGVAGSSPDKAACGRARARQALPPFVSARPGLNLSHGPSRRCGAKLVLRGHAGAEGKDDRAP